MFTIFFRGFLRTCLLIYWQLFVIFFLFPFFFLFFIFDLLPALIFSPWQKWFMNFLYFRTWNSNTNRNNICENSFIKIYWIRYGFEVERDSLLTKSKNISRYQTTNLLETSFLFLVCKKEKERIKANL